MVVDDTTVVEGDIELDDSMVVEDKMEEYHIIAIRQQFQHSRNHPLNV